MAATWAGHKYDGYDHAPAADIPKGYFSGTAGAQIDTADTPFNRGYGRKGGELVHLPGNYSTWRWAGKIRRSSTTTENFIELEDSGSFQIIFRLLSSGVIEVYRGALATLLGSTAAVVPADQWLWCVVLVTIHNSAGVVKIFISNVTTPVLDLTGQDTQATGNATADRIHTLGDSTMWFDDSHISWGSGTVVDGDCLPESTCYTDFALTQGDYQDFTPDTGTNHISQIADRPTGLADGDGSYVSDNVAGDREAVLFDDLPADVTDINGVQITAMVRKNDAAARTVKLGTRRAGTNTDGAAQNATDTYQFLDFCQDQDPNTSASWTRTNVNATQGMVKIES